MKYKAVIFDLFGTLVDPFAASVGQMQMELAAALAVPYDRFTPVWNETAAMRTIGEFQTVESSIEHVCALLGVSAEPDQMRQAVQIRLKYIKQALKPRSNTIETITQLKMDGYRTGLISNCSIEIPILWEQTAFAGVIDTPIFSSRARLQKPDGRIYKLACEILRVAPESCIFIADGEDHELAGATQVGLLSVLIRTPSQEITPKLHQEAREWQGISIFDVSEVFELVRS